MLLAWGRSHRTSADAEIIRWGTDLARIEGVAQLGAVPPVTEAGHDRGGPQPRRRRRQPQADPGQRRGAPADRPGRVAPDGRVRARRRCSSWPARRGSAGRPSTPWPPALAGLPARPGRPTGARSSSATGCCGRSARRRPRRDELPVLGRRPRSTPAAAIVAERLAHLDALAGPLARAHAEIAPGRGPRCRSAALRDERAGRGRGVAAGRPGPAPGRDRREGGLERGDARRAAPRRHGLRAGRPRPGRVRLARPAADRDPGPQAGRARPADGARRPAARCSSSTTCSASSTRTAARHLVRRIADAAPGVRDDDDARRPRPGAARPGDQLGGRRRRRGGSGRRRGPASSGRRCTDEPADDRRATTLEEATGAAPTPGADVVRLDPDAGRAGRSRATCPTSDARAVTAPADAADRRPDPRCGPPAGPRGRAPDGPRPDDLGRARRRAGAGRRRRRAAWSASTATTCSSRPTRRSSARSCGCARPSSSGRSGLARRLRGLVPAHPGAPRVAGGYHRPHLPAASGRSVGHGRPSAPVVRVPRPSPNRRAPTARLMRPAWPYGSR